MLHKLLLSLDPMDTIVSDIDTSRPRIKAQVYDLRIVSVKREPSKDNEGERLTITHETTAPAQSTEGETVNAGHRIIKYMGISEKPERMVDDGKGGQKKVNAYTREDIAKALAGIGKAARLSVTPRQLLENPQQLEGIVVRAKVRIDKETSTFPENNSIGDYVVVK